ncbi:NAD-dependent epimerase/dehydratase family protein [Bacillus hwajinpoensis]|uniref:NAD-dependent epimerase/dehydratase family protein n=1 Tax=Guptibacillus hwajinpoensis TaxID=208199 RepID=A0A845F1B2_9BACL|nr:NAD(P)-dependent oxidoreductase [Pseudalkalibacillus hwajinpoensis]MYL64762.1 NAD-dependent epimerase/dehydratase family protein [Pseudalkalibacillus hwajinpoensis]
MKKVFITGGLGFIGYHLTDFLLNKGIEVVGIDGKVEERRKPEYEMKEMMLLRNANYKQINSRIEEASLDHLSKDCDTIFHLSSPKVINMKQSSKMIENSLDCTRKVVEASKGKVLVHLSSTEVFGTRYGSITERTPHHPHSNVGKLKSAEEHILLNRKSDIVKILRLPLVYGPWQPSHHVFQHYFLHHKLPLKYEEEGVNAHFDAVYVKDVCESIYQAATRREQSETFNLTSGREGEWQRGVEWCIGDSIDLHGEKKLRCGISNKQCASKLGFTNITSIEEGLHQQRLHTEKMIAFDPSIYLT